ncbi:hypothetical protein AB205_0126670 [Aquarana catesbeiana]|uniref:WW domain-containing protein n=1 Tax=Aquarana catesbeiana TaxID=8400 RepID=A0A2G9RYK1_AQUCT|nr:hypothetical protein AB205_0126670 [Aquarana catesbeiana]
MNPQKIEDSSQVPLPPGWQCYMSPQGRRYYVNTVTNGRHVQFVSFRIEIRTHFLYYSEIWMYPNFRITIVTNLN